MPKLVIVIDIEECITSITQNKDSSYFVGKGKKYLNLRYHNAKSDEQIFRLAEALKNNTILDSISFSHNSINVKCIQAILEALETNKHLTELHINENYVNKELLYSIQQLLRRNTTLNKLNLRGNNIDSEGAKILAKGLKDNNTLNTLDIYNNQICDDGIEALAGSLEDNFSITSLDTKHNMIPNIFIKELNGQTIVVRNECNKEVLFKINNLLERNKNITPEDYIFLTTHKVIRMHFPDSDKWIETYPRQTTILNQYNTQITKNTGNPFEKICDINFKFQSVSRKRNIENTELEEKSSKRPKP